MAEDNRDLTSALLVMDMQNMIVQRIGDNAGLLERIRTAIHTARQAGMPVIYVVVKFRPGFPEISPLNKSFQAVKANAMPMTEADEATAINIAVAPREEDVIVTKRRVGAFSGSDLDVVLRAQGIRHLVLTGIATSGVVLSTVRLAADLDFQITVLSDGCADGDAEVHQVLMNKVFPRQADVMTVAEWAATVPQST